MKTNPPRLVFDGGQQRKREIVGWVGPWPPPEQFLVIDGRTGSAHMDVADLNEFADTLDELRGMGCREYRFERQTYSQLPDSIDWDSNARVFRGALYRPSDDVTADKAGEAGLVRRDGLGNGRSPSPAEPDEGLLEVP